MMHFLLTCLWVCLIILRLPPTHYHDPSMTTITGESPETVIFACRVMLDSYAVVAVDWKNSNRLRLKTRGIRESVDSLCRDGADAQYMQYLKAVQLHHKHAKSLFEHPGFLFECLCDQQDSYKWPKATRKTAKRKSVW